MSVQIREREKQAIIASLRAGVVPRIGLQHIQVLINSSDRVRAVD